GIPRRELGEAEGDRELAQEDRRPGPEEGRPPGVIPQVEELGKSGQDREIRESDGECGEAPQRPMERWPVAESGEVAGVAARGRLRQGGASDAGVGLSVRSRGTREVYQVPPGSTRGDARCQSPLP